MKKTNKAPIKEPSCKTIPFDDRTEAERLADAAWDFAYAALWPQEKFRESETKAIKNIVAYYLQDDSFLRLSFKIFIEAIVLYKKHLDEETILHPLVWLNQGYGGGFTKALQCYQEVQELRKTVPLYEHPANVLATLIFKYTNKPTPAMIRLCRSTLLLQRDETLLNLFYCHLIHANYIH
jgi:hypothetical protein